MTKTSLVFLMIIFYPSLGWAEKDKALEEELQLLHEAYNYTVTASKVLENVDKSIATVTVMSEQQIRNMGARNLLDVLKLVPGLGITQSEYGFREIEVRGVKTPLSEKVLLMLNGHPLDHNLQNSGSTWVYDDLPIDNIKRVEIVRGSGSALYGANAFLATINIITKEPKDLNGLELTARGGSFASQQYHLTAGEDFSGLKIGTDFHYADTDGIQAFITEKNPGVTSQPTSAPGYAKPHEQRYDLGWNAEYKNLKLEGRFINKKTGTFIGFGTFGPDSRLEYTDYFIRAAHQADFGNKLSINTKMTYSSFSFNNLWQLQPQLFFKAAVEDTKFGGESQLTYRVNSDNIFIMGFSAEQQSQYDPVAEVGLSPNSLQPIAAWGVPRNRFLWNIYAQDIWDILPNLRLVAGARFDHYSDFGGTFNPRLGFNWEISTGYALRFSYGSAFRAPSFGETTLINNTALLGTPSLKPEKVKTFELGFSAHFTQALQSQLTLYRSEIENLVSLQPVASMTLQYQNADKVIAQGIELESKYNFTKNTYLAFNYVYQNAKNQHLQHLADTPKHRANIMMNVELADHFNFYVDTLVKGNTDRAIGDNRKKVGSYALVNTALTMTDIGFKGLNTSFSVFNLLNKHYVSPTAIGSLYNDMPQAERAFFGAVKIKF
jgi:iron complex outermembrane receptor protein